MPPADSPPGPSLSGRQRRHLRALGHHQKPVLELGVQGLTPGVVQAVDRALVTHELVKVRIGGNATQSVAELGTALASETRSALAQTIGRTLLLYRPHPDEPRIVLPHGDEPATTEEKT